MMERPIRLLASMIVAGCLATTGLVAAQERKSEKKEQKSSTRVESKQRTETRSTEIRRSSLMIGATVNLSGGTRFGEVEEFVINDHGCIDFVIVVYEGRYVPVPWVVTRFDFGARVFVLDIEEDRIKEIPTFTKVEELSKTEFVQKVDKFFGVETRSRGFGPQEREGDRSKSKKDQPGETKSKKPGDEKKPADTKKPGAAEKKPSPEKKADEASTSDEKKSDTEKKPTKKLDEKNEQKKDEK